MKKCMNGLMNVVVLGFERKALVFGSDTFARMVMSTCTSMDHFPFPLKDI